MKKVQLLIVVLTLSLCIFSLEGVKKEGEFEAFADDYFEAKREGDKSAILFLKDASNKNQNAGFMGKLALYDLTVDFTDYLKDSPQKQFYADVLEALKTESYDKEGTDDYSLMALLLSRRFDDFRELSKKTSVSKEIEYMNLLCDLFSSEHENFKNNLSVYLSKYNNNFERYKLVRYSLMTSYASDGEMFLQHFKKNNAKTRIIASITAKETPVMYEILLEEGKEKEAEKLKELLKKSPSYFAEVILIDHEHGRLDKKDLKEFVFAHKEFPLNVFFLELQ
ncbi:MAG: hypothetical protein AB7T10_00580 [bacterium]